MTSPEPEIIAPALARAAIHEKIIATLGIDYEREWLTTHNADYLVRLNKGVINLDFQCDLLGHVDIIERPINPLQASGRFLAWSILVASLFVALFIAFAAGVLK